MGYRGNIGLYRENGKENESYCLRFRVLGFPKIRGTFFGGPHDKDYSILGSILGSPCFGKLPCTLPPNKMNMEAPIQDRG